jgi:hexaprenyl-diphosphate synthase
VLESDGIEQTRALARHYVDEAKRSIGSFVPSDAKQGLLEMCTRVLQRKK